MNVPIFHSIRLVFPAVKSGCLRLPRPLDLFGGTISMGIV